MTREEAVNVLKNTTLILGRVNGKMALAEALQMAITALETDGDCISRQAILDMLGADDAVSAPDIDKLSDVEVAILRIRLAMIQAVLTLPSVQPEPFSDAYMKAVWTWLLDYQIKVAELNGRYTPYEVLSWVVNDWRKEHE